MTKENDVTDLDRVSGQVHRYFTAVHGPNYVYNAPETYSNLVERWMLAVAAGDLEYASEIMAQIEQMAAKQRRP